MWRRNWPPHVELTKKKIPEGTTGEMQPLDTGFNCFFKYILKRLVDFITIEGIDIIVSVRENLVKLIALTYNQMDVPVFYPLIKAAWVKAGLLEVKNSTYENPRDVCFNTSLECDLSQCNGYSIV